MLGASGEVPDQVPDCCRDGEQNMKEIHFVLRRALIAWTAITISANASFAAIAVRDKTLVFTPAKGKVDPPRSQDDDNRLEKVVAFENELEIETGDWIDGSDASSIAGLISNLKRSVVQGVRFAVSKNKALAVVMSYYCTMEEYGAEFPFVCNAFFVIVDDQGRMLGSAKGNFYYVEIHDDLPYIILKEHTCCDGLVRSVLMRSDGKRLCSIADHRDQTWTSEKRIKCMNEETLQEMNVTLTK